MILTHGYLNFVIDIIIVGLMAYSVYSWFKGTRAFQILLGLAFLLGLSLVAEYFKLSITTKVFSYIFDNLLIFILIVFQRDIRNSLASLGEKWTSFNKSAAFIEEIIRACDKMAEERVGALIVLERSIKLDEYIKKAITLNADISEELILTIFNPETLFHDGAAIISSNKIKAASAILPLTQNENVNLKFGTRHRAALGISEETDSLVIIVSEQRGEIRIAENGLLTTPLNSDRLRSQINKAYENKNNKLLRPLLNYSHKILKKIGKLIKD